MPHEQGDDAGIGDNTEVGENSVDGQEDLFLPRDEKSQVNHATQVGENDKELSIDAGHDHDEIARFSPDLGGDGTSLSPRSNNSRDKCAALSLHPKVELQRGSRASLISGLSSPIVPQSDTRSDMRLVFTNVLQTSHPPPAHRIPFQSPSAPQAQQTDHVAKHSQGGQKGPSQALSPPNSECKTSNNPQESHNQGTMVEGNSHEDHDQDQEGALDAVSDSEL